MLLTLPHACRSSRTHGQEKDSDCFLQAQPEFAQRNFLHGQYLPRLLQHLNKIFNNT